MSEAIERGEAPLTLDSAAIRAADRAARIWEAGKPGPIVLGSEEHKQAFCRMLLDTHNPYRPSVVDWPVLECEARDRLVSLPIWDIAMPDRSLSGALCTPRNQVRSSLPGGGKGIRTLGPP